MKGKLIAIYGINNIGKTTQSELLAQYLSSKGFKVKLMKFPDYSLEPTGPKLDKLLRSEKQIMPEKELQFLFIENLKKLTPIIKELLDKGIFIIFEDYYGTTLAWGSVKGLDIRLLKKETAFAVKEDLAILLDGERFSSGKEPVHIHEQNGKLIDAVRKRHLELAQEFGWKIINANQDKNLINKQIIEEFEKII